MKVITEHGEIFRERNCGSQDKPRIFSEIRFDYYFVNKPYFFREKEKIEMCTYLSRPPSQSQWVLQKEHREQLQALSDNLRQYERSGWSTMHTNTSIVLTTHYSTLTWLCLLYQKNSSLVPISQQLNLGLYSFNSFIHVNGFIIS